MKKMLRIAAFYLAFCIPTNKSLSQKNTWIEDNSHAVGMNSWGFEIDFVGYLISRLATHVFVIIF